MNEAMKDIDEMEKNPVSIFWVHTKFPSTLLNVTYELAHATKLTEAEAAVSKIISPGLNVMYGDTEGNIAWWAAAKLMKRPLHVDPVLFLDGSSGKDDITGYYDFKDNPHSLNPESGFLYSANNQPDSMQGILLPGYYVPDDRAKKIVAYSASKEKFNADDFMSWQKDVINEQQANMAKKLFDIIQSQNSSGKDQISMQALNALHKWNGSHEVDDVAPTIYYKLLYHIWSLSLVDEIGEKSLETFLHTHLMKNSIGVFISNENSGWWDNRNTNQIETRNEILVKAFELTVQELQKQLGKNVNDWHWGRVHTLEHVNAVGRKKPLNEFFNVGPMPALGGMETLNNSGFSLNAKGKYPATYGPAMRIIIDFADMENSISINPTGQSGVFSSKHYNDQAQLYINCKYRKQMMNEEEIKKTCKDVLLFKLK
jgi:penicillin amidase